MTIPDKIEVATTSFEIDKLFAPQGIGGGKSCCIIKTQDAKWYARYPLVVGGKCIPTFTKPIGAYLKYINTTQVPEGVTSKRTFTKKKGMVVGKKSTVEVSASFGVAFKAAEAEASVKTGFENYEENYEEETIEYEIEVKGGTNYDTFQPVILYANMVRMNEVVRDHLKINGIDIYEKDGFYIYMRGMTMNSPVNYNVVGNFEPVHEKKFVEELLSDKWSDEWYTEVAVVRGMIYSPQVKRYATKVASKYGVFRLNKKERGDVYVITEGQHIYNESLGMMLMENGKGKLGWRKDPRGWEEVRILLNEEKKLLVEERGYMKIYLDPKDILGNGTIIGYKVNGKDAIVEFK
ncbi:MAG: hypothetical protein F6K22_00615 [Okeania sp. SIO2F4]|uniref:hypothetical protein n=1 Tax=Okeania sp. SIO2F4 TaxID=2607790 RepID=UPI00142AEC70|nr:hypothetical protein [Okeania sp. SIO2F4]NES01476.1 hypothetical protein [Okeania sp. SIO2F4]